MRRLIAALLLTAAALFCGTGCPDRPSTSELVEPPPPPMSEQAVEATETADAQPDTVAMESDAEATGSEAAQEDGQEGPSGDDEPVSSDDGELATPETPEGEVVPLSDDRKLEATDLSALDNWHLTLARNEIFARHGRPFNNEHIRAHFMGLNWYSPDENYEDASLSFVERRNAAFILKYQELKYDIPAMHP